LFVGYVVFKFGLGKVVDIIWPRCAEVVLGFRTIC